MADDIRERYMRPKALQDRIFQKLFEQAEIAKYSDLERRQYEESKKVFWDNYSVMKTAHDKGKAEGRAEGKAEGRAEEKMDNARKMKTNGFAVEDIMDVTGLTAEEISAL